MREHTQIQGKGINIDGMRKGLSNGFNRGPNKKKTVDNHKSMLALKTMP
jgi:hypothetical protein